MFVIYFLHKAEPVTHVQPSNPTPLSWPSKSFPKSRLGALCSCVFSEPHACVANKPLVCCMRERLLESSFAWQNSRILEFLHLEVPPRSALRKGRLQQLFLSGPLGMTVNNSRGPSSPWRSKIGSYWKPGSKFLDKTGDPPNSSMSSTIGSRCATLIGTQTLLKSVSLEKSPVVPVAAALHLLPARR
ncbi:uncharacterized protein LOC143658681 [Tamandua tetradactyla]|uniref:uncharacterized protein LOC143658681 n=1 Tax=Tamandua tetradactyla TaxID=48850 RepID=UPI004053F163